MPANQLVADCRECIDDRELAEIRSDLCEEHAFEDVIANLFAQRRIVAPFDGVDDFVRFFEYEMAQRLEGLFAVPGAAVRTAERGHDLYQPDELERWSRHEGLDAR